MKTFGFLKSPYSSLLFNFAYAIANCIVGFYSYSWWFITVGAYYAILTITRYCVLSIKRKAAGSSDKEAFAQKTTGILLLLLSFCIVGVNILSAIKDRGTSYHEIIMIAIATYTFTKITLAIIGMIKAGKSGSPVFKTLRNIALADACVSVYTMQRSMLVTFPGMSPEQIQLFNILTGTGVWIILLLLGINLIGGKFTDMAKSKIVKAARHFAVAVTTGYKKIESGIVRCYCKIENKFVDTYLTKDGETVEEAKARLKKEHKSH